MHSCRFVQWNTKLLMKKNDKTNEGETVEQKKNQNWEYILGSLARLACYLSRKVSTQQKKRNLRKHFRYVIIYMNLDFASNRKTPGTL